MGKHCTKLIKIVLILTLLCSIVFWPKSQVSINAAEEDGQYDIINGLYIALDEETSASLSNKYFEGYITFEYLDEGTGKFKILTDTDRPAAEGSDYGVVASINKGNTGNWVKAKVRVYPENAAFSHKAENDSDFIFKGDAKVRNISFDFDVITMNP